MLSKAMLQRQQQLRVTPLKTFYVLNNVQARSFASKSTAPLSPATAQFRDDVC